MRRLIIINGGKTGSPLGPFGMSSPSNPPNLQEISSMKRRTDYSPVSDSDREDIVQMIDFGWTDDQILQMLPHIERGSITAYRAHVTRGTYDAGTLTGTGNRTVVG